MTGAVRVMLFTHAKSTPVPKSATAAMRSRPPLTGKTARTTQGRSRSVHLGNLRPPFMGTHPELAIGTQSCLLIGSPACSGQLSVVSLQLRPPMSTIDLGQVPTRQLITLYLPVIQLSLLLKRYPLFQSLQKHWMYRFKRGATIPHDEPYSTGGIVFGKSMRSLRQTT